MPKINNVTRPIPYTDLQVDEIVEFGSCTSEWRILANDGRWLDLEQIKGKQVGQRHHTQSPVQLVEPRDSEFVDGVQVTVCTLPDYEPSHMNTVAALAVITAALPAGLAGTKIESGAFDGDFLVSLRNDWRDYADTDWYIQTRSGQPYPGTSFSVIISAEAR